MTRKLTFIFSAFFVSFLFSGISQAEVPVKPNILFIAVDDLRDWTGYFGTHPQIKTPNMDRLASKPEKPAGVQ